MSGTGPTPGGYACLRNMATIQGRWLHGHLHNFRHKRKWTPLGTRHGYMEAVHRRLAARYAKSTWQARGRAWSRFRQVAAKVGAQTAKGEGSALKQVLVRLFPSAPTSFLDDYLAALGDAEAKSITQALPMPKTLFWEMMSKISHPELYTVLFLTWKTASRVADIRELKKAQIIKVSNKELLVVFHHTKSCRNGEWSPDHVILVQHSTGIPPIVTKFIGQLKKHSPLTKMTSGRVCRLLQMVPVDLAWRHNLLRLSWANLRRKFTAHSLKRGALHELWGQAAEGNVSTKLIPFLAKHKTDWEIPAVGVRYAPNLLQFARTLGSDQATRLL